MGGFDYGQAEISAFVNRAVNGEIVYEPGVAEAAAACYDPAITMLFQQRDRLARMLNLGGFGGFPSGRALHDGFHTKAINTIRQIDLFIDAMYQMQYAFLSAGGKLKQGDANAANGLHEKMAAVIADDEKLT